MTKKTQTSPQYQGLRTAARHPAHTLALTVWAVCPLMAEKA